MLSLAGGRKEGREEGIGTKEGRKAGRKEGSCKTLARYPAQRPLQLSKEDSLGKLRDICFFGPAKLHDHKPANCAMVMNRSDCCCY